MGAAIFVSGCSFPDLADAGHNRLAPSFVASQSVQSGGKVLSLRQNGAVVSVVVAEQLVGSFDCPSPYGASLQPPLGSATNLAVVLCVADTSGKFFVVTDQMVLEGPTDLCSGAVSNGLSAVDLKAAYFSETANCR